MSYFEDLSTNCLAGYGADVRAIGWLHPDYSYSRGDAPAGFLDCLRKHVANAWERCGFMGVHTCEFCTRNPPNPPNPKGRRLLYEVLGIPQDAIGKRNVCVPTVDRVYIAPEMIVHYVVHHSYCPADEFVQAVLACPPQGSIEFMRLIDTFIPTKFPLEFDRRAREQTDMDRRAAAERANRIAKEKKTTAEWCCKGMCRTCGEWLYFYFEDDRREHCGQPLNHVETRSLFGHQQPA